MSEPAVQHIVILMSYVAGFLMQQPITSQLESNPPIAKQSRHTPFYIYNYVEQQQRKNITHSTTSVVAGPRS